MYDKIHYKKKKKKELDMTKQLCTAQLLWLEQLVNQFQDLHQLQGLTLTLHLIFIV